MRVDRRSDAGSSAAGPRDVPALFAAVAAVGPFFAVATGPEPEPSGGVWTPVSALGSAPRPGADPLALRIASVQAALGTDVRVGASTAFLGLAAQLVGPLFAAAAIAEALPAAGPEGAPAPAALADALHWRPGGAGPWLWWAGGAGRVVPGSPQALADLLTGLLTPVVAGVRMRTSISGRVLWGNVASAVASARRLVAADRPDLGGRATVLAERLLTRPPLAATGELRPPEPPDARWTFRRLSCCLYYRVPGGGTCGDCVLGDRNVPRPAPRRVR